MSMGKGINISKYKFSNEIYYYHVFQSQNDPTFYIGIDLTKKHLLFYRNNDFLQEPLGIIDLNHETILKEIPELNKLNVRMAAMQAAIAIHKNEFPDFIGFSS